MSVASENLTQSNSLEQTILIVDDNPINLAIISNYFKGHGFRILIARSGESGLKKAEYVQPDIILLDVMMPGIDGYETCRRLKVNEATQDIPVIFMTALAKTENKVKGFAVGAVDYVTKPLEHSEVLARVTTHLKLRDLTRSLQTQNERLEKLTDELQAANIALSKRAIQLEAGNQVGQQVTSILELAELLAKVVESIQSRFGYYFVGVWLLTEQQEAVVLQAGTGGEMCSLIELGFSIPLETDHSIIVEVCQTGRSYLTDDVRTDGKYLFLEGLPETRSELALPLHVGQKMIGVLDIQSEQEAAFDDEDKAVLQTLANQIAIAIRNAQLYKLKEEKARDLAELNATKDKFFSIVAHDLKGPLHPLLGLSKLLPMVAETAPRSEIKEMGEIIHRSTKNISTLLENLLQWAWIERGWMAYQPTRLDLKQITEQNVDLLAEFAAGKGIDLQNSVPEETFVYADKNMLDTVIRNLISNALKFTSQGERVTISAKPDNSSPECVKISVSDTGAGISEENLNKLFKLKVHHTTKGTAKEKGVGLGLIICREMVEKNGGRIWIESKVGQGTTVKFLVPLDSSGGIGSY